MFVEIKNGLKGILNNLMTVKELIEELLEFDENLEVRYTDWASVLREVPFEERFETVDSASLVRIDGAYIVRLE